MAKKTAKDLPQGYKRNVKREGPVAALLQVVVVLALVGAAVFFYKQYSDERKRVADLVAEARVVQRGDDAPSLLEAKAKYEATGSIEKNDRAIVSMAELSALLYANYGMQEMKDEAQKWIELAKNKSLEKEERYSAEAYMLLGDGNPAAAEAVITALTDKGIRKPKLLHALAAAKLAQGKAREAQIAAEEAMKLSTGLVRLPIIHGDALLAQGNFTSASSAYSKALSLNANHLRARTAILLVQAVSRSGKPKLLHKAADNLRADAKDIGGGTPPPRVLAFIDYADGEIYLSAGDAKKAIAQADKALAADPKLDQAIFLKGRAFAAERKLDKAIAEFNKALAMAPTSIVYADAAFGVLDRQGKAKKGVAFLEKVQAGNPENPHVYPPLAIAQAKAGKAKEATASAKTAIDKLGDASPEAIFAVARALQANKKYADARKKYSEAIQERGNQEWPEVFAAMGELAMEEKDYSGAAQWFKQAVTLWEKKRADRFLVADTYERQGKAIEAQGGKKNKKAAKEKYDLANAIRAGKR